MNISTTAFFPCRPARSTVLPVASLSLKGCSFSPMATAPAAGRATARPTLAMTAGRARLMFISLIRAASSIVCRLARRGRRRQERVQLLDEDAARHRSGASRLSCLLPPIGVDVAEEADDGQARERRLAPQGGQRLVGRGAPAVEIEDHEPRRLAARSQKIGHRSRALHLEPASLGRLADAAEEHQVVDEGDYAVHAGPV